MKNSDQSRGSMGLFNSRKTDTFSYISYSNEEIEKERRLIGVVSVCYIISRILLVLWAIISIVYAFAARQKPLLPLFTVVYLLLVAIVTILYMLDRHSDFMELMTTRPVVLGPVGFMFYTLIRYIFCSAYKTHSFTGFVGGQLIILLFVVAAGIVSGFVINKKRIDYEYVRRRK